MKDRLRRPGRLLVVGLGLCLCAPVPLRAQSSALPAAGTGAADTTAALRPGDVVRITVWRNDEMSGEFGIAADGTIQHPLYQHIVAAGVPAATLRKQVAALLGQFESSPQFVMQPLIRVAVGGEVRVPGVQTVPPEATMAGLIVGSGGVTETGALQRVQLVRDGHRQMLDLTREDMRDAMLRVRSGDQILVLRRRSIMSDFVLPASSIIAALGSVALLFRR